MFTIRSLKIIPFKVKFFRTKKEIFSWGLCQLTVIFFCYQSSDRIKKTIVDLIAKTIVVPGFADVRLLI